MSSVNLPFKMPMFSTYHNIAGAGVVAANNPTSDIWYYNNAIQWRCIKPGNIDYQSLDLQMLHASVWDMPFVDKTDTSLRFIRKYIAEIIEDIISESCYVIFGGVDDYFIEGKSGYRQRHFAHDGLITGFDSERRVFTMAAYNTNFFYKVFETPYDGFINGVNYMCDRKKYGIITAAAARNEIQTLDVSHIKEEIFQYMQTSTVNGSYGEMPIEVVYGSGVYDCIILYLECFENHLYAIDNEIQIVFKLIYEHKRCMFNRIKYVEAFFKFDNFFSEAYKQVVKISEIARMAIIKFGLTREIRLIETVKKHITKMKDIEYNILNGFINKF